jgi:predicted DNA binding CopG/RHH family protein
MASKTMEIPKFKFESEEAEWWASTAGRSYVKQLNGKRKSTQIAIRLPEADIAQARKIAERKGVGYQTLLKMLVYEGLRREGRRR